MDAKISVQYASPTGPTVITRQETCTGVWFTMEPRPIWTLLLWGFVMTAFLILVAFEFARRAFDFQQRTGWSFSVLKYIAACVAIACALVFVVFAIYQLIGRRGMASSIGIVAGKMILVTPRHLAPHNEFSLDKVAYFSMTRVGIMDHWQLTVHLNVNLIPPRYLLSATTRNNVESVLSELNKLLLQYRAGIIQ